MSTVQYQRQAGLLPPDILWNLPIAVAGVGAVGRQVVLQLCSAGARNLAFYDHDTVEESNIGPQGWRRDDIGVPKVEALLGDIERQQLFPASDGATTAKGLHRRFPTESYEHPIVFCCVDNINTRGQLFRTSTYNLFLDSRVAGDTVHVLSVSDPDSRDYYESTLFDREEAFQATCTTRMSIHIANIAAGLLVQQFSKWLRELPTDRHTVFNLLAMESYSK